MSVRVPRVAIDIDLGEGNRIGEVSLLSVGYGFRQAWIYATIFSSLSIFGINPAAVGFYGTTTTVTGLSSIITFAAVLIFMAFTDQQFLRFYTERKTLIGGALATVVGTLLLLIPNDIGPTPLFAVEIVSGVLTGMGTGILIIFWGIAFARRNSISVIIDTAVAIVLGLVIFVFVICKLPAPFGGLLTAALPLFELCVLFKLTPVSFARENRVPIFKPLPVHAFKFAKQYIPSVFLFGIVLGIMRHASIQSIAPSGTIEKQAIGTAASCVVALLVLLTLAATGKENSGWLRMFKVVVPLIAVSVVFLPYFSTASSLVVTCIVMAGYLMFEMTMWSFFGILSQCYRLSPVLVYGFGRGTLSFASTVGAMMIMQVDTVTGLNASTELIIAVVLLLILFFAYILMPNQRTIESTINMTPPSHVRSSSFYEGSTTNLEPYSRPTFIKVNTAEGTMTEMRAPLDAAMQAEEVAADAEAPAAQEAAASPAEETPSAAAEQEAVIEAPLPSEIPQAPKNAAAAPLATNTATAFKKGAGSLTEKPAETAVSPDERLARECEKVANTYLLSRRETEVCFFLARGHNSSYIQEKLYISEGTAKTHIRHIYRKLDIHSQEELIRLVEEAGTQA